MISVAEAIDADTLRIRHEFLALPALRTSPDTCAHVLNVSPRRAAHMLEALVREGFLDCVGDHEYVRHVTAAAPRRCDLATSTLDARD